MKNKVYIYIFWIIVILLALMGCTTTKPTIIQTNEFIQTDYDYNCLTSDKTFSQIILCYQAQDKAEKAQNKITNQLIMKNRD